MLGRVDGTTPVVAGEKVAKLQQPSAKQDKHCSDAREQRVTQGIDHPGARGCACVACVYPFVSMNLDPPVPVPKIEITFLRFYFPVVAERS